MQDPKHRNQMLRSPLKPSWLVAEKAEMDGLYRRKCWVKVLRSSLTPQDKDLLHEVSLQDQAQRRTVRKVQSPFGHTGTAHAQKRRYGCWRF
jgi:hypothetical protein